MSIFAATVLVAGCQSSKPTSAPRAVDDRPLRIRVAHAEAQRADGIAELTELAATGEVNARVLALRGLGRIGGPVAMAALDRALADREPRVVAAALHAIGIAASLDDKVEWNSEDKIVAALAHADLPVRLAAIEVMGRGASTLSQPALARCLGDTPVAVACALALGRHGRRKLPLSEHVRLALAATASRPGITAELRYAATYALAREHEPTPDEQVNAALVANVTAHEPEVRATAIAGLAKRKLVIEPVARKAIEESLRDVDWRVAVEAVRALAASDDAGRALVAISLQRRWSELVKGNAAEAHVITEALRALATGKPITDRAHHDAITSLAQAAASDTKLPALTRGWIECLAHVAAPQLATGQIVEAITSCRLPDHLRLPLLADVVKSGIGEPKLHRAALRVLLGHDDARVRAAGLGVLAATWAEADPRAQATLISTETSALASKNPIVVGSAVEAADSLYEKIGTDGPHRAALDHAIATRAAIETDLDIATSLYGVIGKRAIAGGVEACRAGLAGHPVRAKAARECLRELGEAVPAPGVAAAQPPPHDVTEVIGRKVTWQLTTSRGLVEIELRPDVAPWAVATVVALTRRGFYDGLELHRVVPNFVAQGGDPTMSGYGGPGFTLPAEAASSADGGGFMAGGVGIADAGPDSGGSQWFVMHSRAPHLDGRYTWIGSVVSGQKSADALLIGDRVERARVQIK